MLLQRVVEKIVGRPIAEYMRTAVFEPLGMTQSTFAWTPEIKNVAALGHDRQGALLERSLAFYEQRNYETLQKSGLNPASATYEQIAAAYQQNKQTFLPVALSPNMAGSLQTTIGDYAVFLAHVLKAATRSDDFKARVDVNRDIAWAPGWGVDRSFKTRRCFTGVMVQALRTSVGYNRRESQLWCSSQTVIRSGTVFVAVPAIDEGRSVSVLLDLRCLLCGSLRLSSRHLCGLCVEIALNRRERKGTQRAAEIGYHRLLLVIDSSLDHGLYARRHVGKEIEARNRLDLIHAHSISSPVTVNRSRVRYYHRNRSRRRRHSRNIVSSDGQYDDHLPCLRGHCYMTVRDEELQSLATGNDVKLVALRNQRSAVAFQIGPHALIVSRKLRDHVGHQESGRVGGDSDRAIC